jgi:methyl-accepting chemotaxis protein
MEWINKLLERYTLSEVRERFVAQVLDGKETQSPDLAPAASGSSRGGSVELF